MVVFVVVMRLNFAAMYDEEGTECTNLVVGMVSVIVMLVLPTAMLVKMESNAIT